MRKLPEPCLLAGFSGPHVMFILQSRKFANLQNRVLSLKPTLSTRTGKDVAASPAVVELLRHSLSSQSTSNLLPCSHLLRACHVFHNIIIVD
jgi:hypothetical protein